MNQTRPPSTIAWRAAASTSTLVVAAGLAMLSSTGEGHAQTAPTPAAAPAGSSALPEVVVTAQRRSENVQDVPIAITAVSSQALQNANVFSFSDISRLAPSVQVGGLQGNQLVIRGVGQQQPGLFSEQGAAIFVDGVYRPRFTFNSVNFSDVDRVEVLRGPQGTLYGKNAVGGAVNIVTNTPGDAFSANASGQYGSHNRVDLSGATNIPVAPGLAVHFAAEYNHQDGYVHDPANGQDYNDTNYYTLHGAVRWEPIEPLTITLRGDYLAQRENGPGYTFLTSSRAPASIFGSADALLNTYTRPEGYNTLGTSAGFNDAQDRGISLQADWKVGPGVLTSITAHRLNDAQSSQDSDGTPVVARFSPTNQYDDEFSQELRYTGRLSKYFRFTIGGFLYRETGTNPADSYDNSDIPGTAQNRNIRGQDAKSYATFGEFTVSPTSKLDLILGLRYTEDSKYVTGKTYNLLFTPPTLTADVQGSAKWDSFTPKGSIEYHFTSDLMSYVTVSKGFKAGGFNTSPLFFQPYAPEEVINYEGGVKSEWFDKRVRLNVTAYQMDYTQIQLNQIISLSPTQTVPVVSNAGNARIRGAEVELQAAPTSNLSLNASFGLTDFKYTHLNPGTAPITLNSVLPNSPKYTFNAGAQYTFPHVLAGEVVLRGDYSYRSLQYFDANDTALTAQRDYGLLSGRVTYQPDGARWATYVYGNNLGDTMYRVAGFTAAGVYSVIHGSPREVGVGARIRF